MTHGNPWKLLFLNMLNQTKTNYLRKLGFLIQTNSECKKTAENHPALPLHLVSVYVQGD